MPRGGKRNGRTGTAYANRSDLSSAQPVRTVPGQSYGTAGAQQQAQRAVPLPQTAQPQMPPAAQTRPAPPDPGLLHAPTARPNEPVTAGVPMGAGPGPEANAMGPPSDQILANLYRAYQMAPTEAMRQIVEQAERLRGIRA